MPIADFSDEPLDVEQLREVLESRGYVLIKERIEMAIATNMKDLLRLEEIGAVRHAQGYVKGLQICIDGIPQVLLQELKARQQRGNIQS